LSHVQVGEEKEAKADTKGRYSLTEGFPRPPKALPPTAAKPVKVDGRLKGSAETWGRRKRSGSSASQGGQESSVGPPLATLHPASLASPADCVRGFLALGFRH
jgi:hypothetical protein